MFPLFLDKPKNNAPYIKTIPADTPPVRIVFVFTINGRADRQVKRLFKALFHEHHYYYIHVDSVSFVLNKDKQIVAYI